jgi:superfamily II DNA helicase RecQ
MPVKHFHLRLSKEHIAEDELRINEFMGTVKVTGNHAQLLTVGSTSYWSIIIFYEEEKKGTANEIVPEAKEIVPLTQQEQARYEALKNWRRAKAAELSVADFIIAHNRELMDIARLTSPTKEMLLEVKGFSEKKWEKYGMDILDVVNRVK